MPGAGPVLPALLGLLAGAAADPSAALARELPSGYRLAQVLRADLDADGREEWIALGEPPPARPGAIWVGIFSAGKGGGPELSFAQRLEAGRLSRAGAVVREVSPVGAALVVIGAEPVRGDTRFAVQLWAFRGGRYRPLLPVPAEFRSQGGFAIEDVDPSAPGDELVAWTYLHGAAEQLHDVHRYAFLRWRFDGIRFVPDAKESRTPAPLPDAAAAGRAAGVRGGDLRRTVPRIAEVD